MGPPVVRFVVAYTVGVWTGAMLRPPAPASLLAAVGLVVASIPLGWRARLASTVATGVAVAAVRSARHQRSCAVRWRPGNRTAVLQLHDAAGARGLTRATVRYAPEGCGGILELRLDSSAVPSGARAVAVGVFRSNGIFRVDHLRILRVGRPWRFVIRDRLRRRIHVLYGARAPVVEAMVLGRRRAVSPELRKQFVAAGLAHLLAISGLHVGIVAGWVMLGLRLLGRGPVVWLGGAAATWGYVTLLGFPVSAMRAAAFVTITALSRTRQRNPPLGAVIAGSVLLILTVDPQSVTAVGAWLSVAAVWGTGAANRVVRARASPSAVARLMASSVGATLATAPITAFVFGSVAPVGVLSNLPGVPLAAVGVPGVLASLVGGPTVAAGAGLCLAGIEMVGRIGAALPGGHLLGEPGLRFAAPWLGMVAGAAWATWRRPTWIVVRRRALMLGALGCWTIWIVPVTVRRYRGDEVVIHVLDVGQGDAIVLRTPRGRWVLIDGGPVWGAGGDAGRRVVAPFLRRRGVNRLDAVVVSHGDADHLGGIPGVVEAFEPPVVLEPGQPLGTNLYVRYLQAVEATGSRWQPARAGDTLVVDSVTLAVVHPSTAWMGGRLDANENSVVLRVSFRRFDALLTGDIGWPAESLLAGGVERVEVLKVGHHGSAGGTRDAWLDALRPTVAVVSVGRGNRYGHPAPEVLRRLEARKIDVYRTDVGGTVTIRSNGSYFAVSQGRQTNVLESVLCLFRTSLPSSGSSSSKSGCTRGPRVSSRAYSTTSP